MNDSTRISDLPDMPSNQMQNSVQQNGWQQQQQNDTDLGNTYKPINVHANPYDNGNDSIQQLQPFPRQDRRQESIQRLPSRDIQMNTNQYMEDEEIKANYIPKPKNVSDYIRDYKEEESERIHNHKNKRNNKNKLDEIYTEFQEILLIGIIFFISQMSIINKIMRQYLLFLGIYDNDGNLNIKGMMFKSVMFSIVYGVTFKMGNKLFPF